MKSCDFLYLCIKEESQVEQSLCKAQVQLMLLNGQQYFPETLKRPLMDWAMDKTSDIEEALVKICANRKKNQGLGGNLFDILKKSRISESVQ